MKKLLLLLILSFFSAQSFAGSCPDGSEPVKSISDDGTFFVYNCGGSAKSSSKTSNNTVASPKVKPKELEANLTFVGEFDLKKLGENKNQNLFAFSVHGETFDINQDGHDDLIIPIASLNSKFRNVPNEFSKPVLLFWDDSLKKYVVDKEVQKALPLLYWPRRFRSSINPKTGFTEIFVADMGLDLAGYDFSKGMENLPPNCGGQNHLITFDPSSGKVAEIPLPKLWDVSHGLAAGDLNGDQVADYVLLNSPYIKYPAKCQYNGLDYTNESYILYSNNKGGFDKVDIKLNYKGYSKAPSIQSGEVIVDENNQSYLVLGSEGGKGDAYLYLMKQDSQNSFTETSKVKAPEILKTVGAPVYGEIFVTDIDGDGTEEVIAASNTVDDNIAMWVGRYIQVFDIENGKLKEREDEMTQSPSSEITKGGDVCHHLFFNEQTAWNEPILTCTNLQPSAKDRGSFYARTNNKFQVLEMKFKSDDDIDNFKWMRSFYPITIDQQTIFVGRKITGKKIINGIDGYNSIKLYLLKSVAKADNSFDGRYSFTVSHFNENEGSRQIGNGYIKINDGIMSVAKEGRTLRTGSIDLYDSFEGQIDKKGNIKGSLTINVLTGKSRLELVSLNGGIESPLQGEWDDYFDVILKLGKKE